jgi:SAM-dependent methyltransferase
VNTVENINWHSNAKERWNENASNWHSRSVDMWMNGSRKDILPFFKNNVERGSSVADLGCGDGFGSYLLHKNGYDVTGMDLSEKMVELAKKQEQPGLRFVQGDLANLPFRDNSFDSCFAINSIEWTETPYHTLQELNRIVRNDGRICIGLLGPTAHPRSNSYPRLLGEKVICNTMMPWELEQLAREVGLDKVDETWVYKNGVKQALTENLSNELKQSLTFMTLFCFKKK